MEDERPSKKIDKWRKRCIPALAVSGIALICLVCYMNFARSKVVTVRLGPDTGLPGATYRGKSEDKIRADSDEITKEDRSTGSVEIAHRTKSPLSQEYHRHWDVNCSAFFAGDEAVIKNTTDMLERARAAGSLMPPDSQVATWTKDCYTFRKQRGYPELANSKEEANFPLAFIILTHRGSAQVERLLRAIYQPQNVYCIHPDAKSPAEFHHAIRDVANCFDNVFIASKLEDVKYAGYSRLLADFNCMRDLTGQAAVGHPWKYLINLCGQDFPMMTNLEIVRSLKAEKGGNIIPATLPGQEKIPRTQYEYDAKGNNLVRTARLKSPIPYNLTVYTGLAYYAASWDFIQFALDAPVAQDLLQWVNNTYSPDETYWATLQRIPGAPGGDVTPPSVHPHVRFILWGWYTKYLICRGKYVHHICVFSVGDLQLFKKHMALFANKFYYEYDPVTLQCLERALDYKVRHPEMLDKFPKLHRFE